MAALATGAPIKPVTISRANITTSLEYCSPTPTRLPIAFVLNCRGKLPNAGASCVKVSVPSWLNANVEMVSEAIKVLFDGSGLGTLKEESFLLPMSRKRLSG